jgi:hypothetical protein
MDGKVLLDLFTEEYRRGRAVERTDADAGSGDGQGGSEYTAAEAAKVEERLKGLGYL